MPRTKAFCEKQALDKATQVFWEKGYDGTTIQDLVDAMGINRFSMYDTYGKKDDLFRRAMDHYRQQMLQSLGDLRKPEAGLRALEGFFFNEVEVLTSCPKCVGCMVTNAVIEMSNHPDCCVKKELKIIFNELEKVLTMALDNAKSDGDIATTTDSKAMATFLMTMMQGLVVMAKAGQDKKALLGAVNCALAGVRGSPAK